MRACAAVAPPTRLCAATMPEEKPIMARNITIQPFMIRPVWAQRQWRRPHGRGGEALSGAGSADGDGLLRSRARARYKDQPGPAGLRPSSGASRTNAQLRSQAFIWPRRRPRAGYSVGSAAMSLIDQFDAMPTRAKTLYAFQRLCCDRGARSRARTGVV